MSSRQGETSAGKTERQYAAMEFHKVKTIVRRSTKEKPEPLDPALVAGNQFVWLRGLPRIISFGTPCLGAVPNLLMNTKRGDLSRLIRGILIINCATNIYKLIYERAPADR